VENLVLTSLKHTARLYRIAITLAQHDALFGLEALKVSPIITFSVKLFAQKKHSKLREGERLTKAFEALGPTFIKLGQALSVRPDLVGDKISDDLSQLRDKVPPFDAKIARDIIEEQLEKPIAELFSAFDEQPIAAASIAQVHFATLKSGDDVAVKVLRPNIRQAFAKDIDLLLWLAENIEERRPQLRRLKPVAMIETFARSIEFELDLRYEAAASSELKENTQADEGYYVPNVHWTLCAEKVLMTERIKGISLNDAEALKTANLDYEKLLKISAGSFFQQVFRDGFFHADMHPGNLFVMPDSTLAVVDFGIMGRIDRATQLYLAEIMWALFKEEYERVATIHIRAGLVPADTSVMEFAQACRAITKPILGTPLNAISVAKLLGQLFQVTETFQMEIQPQLLMLQKSMMLAEGVGMMLQPNMNTWKLSEPLITEWAKANLSPQAILRDHAQEMAQTVRKLPMMLRQTERVLGELQNGGLKLHPDTAEALRGKGRGQRQWMFLAWAALMLLAGIFLVEFSLVTLGD
jgi:ubiquinone biosynthesis protein